MLVLHPVARSPRGAVSHGDDGRADVPWAPWRHEGQRSGAAPAGRERRWDCSLARLAARGLSRLSAPRAARRQPVAPDATRLHQPAATDHRARASRSTAAPTRPVLRGRGAEAGTWFMYCTNASVHRGGDRRHQPATGHRLPVLSQPGPGAAGSLSGPRSRRRAGRRREHSSGPPKWCYSTTHQRYYLTYAVTDTLVEVSGEPRLPQGLEPSGWQPARAPGPWRHAAAGRSSRHDALGPGCSFASTIDPDVVGDTVGDRGVLYYGGYHGGIRAQRISVHRFRAAPVGVPAAGDHEPLRGRQRRRAGVSTTTSSPPPAVLRGRPHRLRRLRRPSDQPDGPVHRPRGPQPAGAAHRGHAHPGQQR